MMTRGEAHRVTSFEGEGVRRLHHTVESLWEEEGREEITGDGKFDGEGVRWDCSRQRGKDKI
jgi:hypothetical protein